MRHHKAFVFLIKIWDPEEEKNRGKKVPQKFLIKRKFKHPHPDKDLAEQRARVYLTGLMSGLEGQLKRSLQCSCDLKVKQRKQIVEQTTQI